MSFNIQALTLDLDDFEILAGYDPVTDPVALVEWAISQLPEPFHNVSCSWAFSSSQNIPDHVDDPPPNIVKLHLTFWQSRCTSNAELKAYFPKGCGVDRALFNPVQAHYTAAPIFGKGLRDPLPQRSGFLEGENDEVTLPPIVIKPKTYKTRTQSLLTGKISKKELRRIESALISIEDQNDDREIWLKVGMALHSTGAEGAFDLWDKWSRSSGKHDPEDQDRVWASFSLGKELLPGDGRAVGLGSIFHFAKEAGWRYADRGEQASDVEPYWTGEELPAPWARNLLAQTINTRLAEMAKWNMMQEERSLEKERAFGDEKHAENIEEEDFDEGGPWDDFDDDDGIHVGELTSGQKAAVSRKINSKMRDKYGFQDLQRAPRSQVKATASIGKSGAVGEAIVGWKGPVFYYVPQLHLADEMIGRLQKNGITVQKIEGRKDPICKKPDACRRAGMLGLPVMEIMCAVRTESETEQGQYLYCDHYEDCKYLAQFKVKADVYVMVHEYLHLPRNKNLPVPTLAIIDESIIRKMVSQTSFGVDRLKSKTGKIVRDCLEKGTDFRLEMTNGGITKEKAEEKAKEHEIEVPHGLWPIMSEGNALKAMEKLTDGEDHKLAKFWRLMANEIDIANKNNRHFHAIKLQKDVPVFISGEAEKQDRVSLFWKKRLTIRQSTPILMIDASADLGLNKQLLGDRLQGDVIRAEMNMKTIQIYSTTMAKNQLLDPKTREKTTKLRKVEGCIGFEAEEADTLVVTNKPIRLAITGEKDEGYPLPASTSGRGAEVAHYGAIEGIDQWKGKETGIELGREEPPKEVPEGIARALYADADDALVFGEYQDVLRGYRMRDESKAGVLVRVLPDPRVQQCLEQIREQGLEQAIARIRPVGAEQQKRCVIMTSIPLDITIDHLVSWEEYYQTMRLERIMKRLGGWLPKAPEKLVELLPRAFKGVDQAKFFLDQWFKKGGNGGSLLIRDIYIRHSAHL